ncbi:NADH:flavin oxidoreductase [Barnesiella intestinihominis]|uniref:NADH:flavin oxidoreductase n=1 Tax=Barnesiella intestinihominis TaxID=487174 RepID=UPI00266C1D4A|nr:NADH:flavin oxidoreductase [Barnesiella intestinihominis]
MKIMFALHSPLTVKSLTLGNRLLFPPMGTETADGDGRVTDRLLGFYRSLSSAGHLSLVIVEHSFVSGQGKASRHQLSAADDSTLDGLREIARIAHVGGAKAVLQLNHAGAATSRAVTGRETVSASALSLGNGNEPSRPLTKAEIGGIVSDFARAAERARRAGFDGVEIHSAHGYLLNQFYSPVLNRRTDGYGGGVSGRIRIHLEIIEAIRAKVGSGYPLFLRLGACDYTPGGTTLQDSILAARELERAGLDVLDVSGGLYGFRVPGREHSEGYFADITQALKRHISIPVVLTGGIRRLETAEDFLRDGVADLIGIGRPIYRNPSWLKAEMERFCRATGNND